MAQEQTPPSGPDLTKVFAFADFAGGKLVGHVGDEEVLLVRSGAELFAIGAHCSHYHGPLADGLVVGETVRCPWHHACFDLRTGEAVRAPALSPVDCWKVEQRGRPDLRREKREQPKPRGRPRRRMRPARSSSSAAAPPVLPRPRCCGGASFGGSIVMLSDDAAPPVDRPNLSKDYLAGSAPEDWLPLRPDDFYSRERHRSAAQHRSRRHRCRKRARSAR